MANNQAEINIALTVCGFSTGPQQNIIMTTEGLDSWIAFTLIDYTDFASISKNTSHHTAPFSLGVLKQKRLAALKFWIEDVIRMNEIPHTAVRLLHKSCWNLSSCMQLMSKQKLNLLNLSMDHNLIQITG